MSERWATFDCYGTLIDWNDGIRKALARLWPREDTVALLAHYHELEPETQSANPASPYRAVMTRCVERLASERGLRLGVGGAGGTGGAESLAESLATWPAFPEVSDALAEARRRGWKLAILSNTDPDLLEASLRHLPVEIDRLVIASEIGSYKPAHGHWREFVARTGARPEQHVHVAASLFHDLAPATALGLRTLWINRLGETSNIAGAPTRELPDLRGLADALDSLVP